MTYEEEFSKEKIIINLAKYEMYYQISLGSLISDSQTKDISPTIELQYALGSIYELISQIMNEDNVNEIFDTELQKQAAMDALQNFVNENLELVKENKIKVEPIVNSINDGQFFHESMLEICDENIDKQIEKWSSYITEEIAHSIYLSVIDMQQK